MRILAFGQTGQVASELAKSSCVQSLSRQDADLSDPEACAAIVLETEADVIINAAAYTAVDRAEEEEALANIINGDAVSAIAVAAASRDIPFLHISTDYVFDGSGHKPWAVTDKVSPVNAYGRSKLLGEQAILANCRRFAILRTSWVYSAHGNNFVKTMLRLGSEREALNIVDDQIGGPSSAADIAQILLSMADAFHREKGKSGIYHYAGAPDVSWAGFATEIFNQAGLKVNVKGIMSSAYPTPAKRPKNSRMDCSTLEFEFGLKRPEWRKSLEHVLKELEVI
jgi:dTDP-4-dehydrorhamnose reductase